MPVLMRLTTSLRPGKRVSATTVPSDMPMKRLMKVASPETLSESHVIPSTSGSNVIKSQSAFLIPSRISSMALPYGSSLI